MSNLELWKRSMSPWAELDGLFDNFLKQEAPTTWSGNMKRAMAARVEVSETPQAFLVKFDIPGLKKEDIKIDLHDNRLTVSGERREEKREERDHKVHYSELSYGSFARAYTFPTAVDAEKVEAAYDGGVLSLHIPKLGNAKARQITIK
ncbi:MAG: Hsp20/alpha crystallin family protein [Bdellovibrionaceae bacterium]|nr:Hsp20/alpha crystallin family protein [Pseudobdellovibrionaceae bacterium]